jgi:hypothetical protein
VAYLTFAKPVTCIPRPPVYGIYDSKTDHIYFINDNSIVASFDVPTLSLTETLTYLRKSADDGA